MSFISNKNSLVLLIAGFFFFASCTPSESIKISGSSTVLPIISKAAEKYKLTHPNVNIIVNSGGSGVGINQVGEGKIEIGMASRDITEEEKKKFANIDLRPISIGKDAVVAVVSSEIYDAGIHSLKLSDIASIYRGEIQNWKELGGPDKDILCIDKEKARGTRHVFMEKIMGDKEAEAEGANLVLGSNNEEQTALVQSDAAIGMLSNAWLNEDVKGLKIILANGEIIEPSLENISNGKFPLTRDLLLITNGNPKASTQEFIDYLLSVEGQNFVKESGYVHIK